MHREIVELSGPPSFGAIYSRAAVGLVRSKLGPSRSGGSGSGGSGSDTSGSGSAANAVGSLPDVEHVLRDVPVEAARLTAYQHLVGEPARDVLPPGFVHVLTFPVSLSVMARGDFPLPLAGMVHLANSVRQHRPVRLGEPLAVRAWAQDLRPHHRGTQVDLRSEVSAGGEPVWSGTATYLAKGFGESRERGAATEHSAASGHGTATEHGAAREDGASAQPGREPSADPGSPTAVWRLPGDLGRRYAAVSGDRNPIHLSSLSARAFGFRRTVAHGMYTASRALAAMGTPDGPLTWDVTFGSPVLVPGTVHVRVTPDAGSVSAGTVSAGLGSMGDDSGRDCLVWDPLSGREHLRASVRPH